MKSEQEKKSANSAEAVAILEKRTRNLRQVNAVSQQLTAMLDSDKVIGHLLQTAANIIGAPIASLWMWEDEKRLALVCRATFPPEEKEELAGYRLPASEGVAGWVVTHKVSAVTDNAYADPRFNSEVDQQTGFMTRSMLAVPLLLRDEVIGVVEILNKQEARFDEEDLAMIETLTASTSIALENATLVASLREKSSQLERRNAEIDAFAHTVAHDLKSPLAAILGYSDFLIEIEYAVEREELDQVCRSIARSATKMNNIIHEILLLSGLRREGVVVIAPVAMENVVEEALHRIEPLRRDRNATVVLPESWPAIESYAPWIEEVWVNYLSNAIKYGGERPEVVLSHTESADGISFWVRDSGPGLTEEQQRVLFQPHTRLDQAKAEGHGLGLSIVQHIVQKLGGSVALLSEPGQGSSFGFHLPFVSPQAQP
jgi:K+-sensing histidine kinase KdpD